MQSRRSAICDAVLRPIHGLYFEHCTGRVASVVDGRSRFGRGWSGGKADTTQDDYRHQFNGASTGLHQIAHPPDQIKPQDGVAKL